MRGGPKGLPLFFPRCAGDWFGADTGLGSVPEGPPMKTRLLICVCLLASSSVAFAIDPWAPIPTDADSLRAALLEAKRGRDDLDRRMAEIEKRLAALEGAPASVTNPAVDSKLLQRASPLGMPLVAPSIQPRPPAAVRAPLPAVAPAQETLTRPTSNCYVGPRGGTYTITKSGKKNYGGC